jgi:PAS domain S-box-containing protein
VTIIQDKVIKFSNRRQAEMSGYTVEELIGKSIYDLAPPDSLSVMKERVALRDQGKDIPEIFYGRLLCKDGTIKETESSTNLIQYESRPASMAITRNITERKREEEKLQQTLNDLKKAVGTTVQVLVSALESRDPYTAGHQSRAANLACAIATEMGLSQDKIEGIRMAGVIHDIGKLSVPVEILAKPTKLTELGFSLVKEHSRSGYEMLKNVESPWPLAQIVHQHHERMDGSGYPRKLKGDEILIEARILAVADVVEAMASHRPYRSAWSIKTALEEIEKNKGILYDNAVADACLKLFREKDYLLP